MYENWKIKKSDLNNDDLREKLQDEQSEVANWCNENQQYRISDDEEFIFVEPIPEPSVEEKAEIKRAIRNRYLEEYVDTVVCNPLRWADLKESEQNAIKDYRRYLLDITADKKFPDVDILSFEGWQCQK